MHVALGHRQIRVTRQLLNRSRGRPFHRQMRTERVPKDVHAGDLRVRDPLCRTNCFDHTVARDRRPIG
jgi:hypothetical protein